MQTRRNVKSEMASFGGVRAAKSARIDLAFITEVRGTLNKKQRLAFDIVCKHIADGTQIRMIVTGVAGTGKSHLCKAIVKFCRNAFGVLAYDDKAPFVDTVVVCAFTGVAAHNVQGHTIHSALHFRVMQRKTGSETVHTKLGSANRRQQDEWRHVRVLIVDEFSFISCQFFVTLTKLSVMPSNNLMFRSVVFISYSWVI